MFGKKNGKKVKPSTEPDIKIDDGNGKVLYEGKLYDLPLKESSVIAKSMELFQDPTPCYIHRGAVMMRIYGEWENFLQSNKKDMPLSAAPDDLIAALAFEVPESAVIRFL